MNSKLRSKSKQRTNSSGGAKSKSKTKSRSKPKSKKKIHSAEQTIERALARANSTGIFGATAAAATLKISSRRVRVLCEQGRLGHKGPNGVAYVITPQEIEAYAKVRKGAGRPRKSNEQPPNQLQADPDIAAAADAHVNEVGAGESTDSVDSNVKATAES